MQKNLNQAEKAESEGIQPVINQVAIQAATAVVLVLRDADAGPQPIATASLIEPYKHGGPALEKTSINWNAQDR